MWWFFSWVEMIPRETVSLIFLFWVSLKQCKLHSTLTTSEEVCISPGYGSRASCLVTFHLFGASVLEPPLLWRS